MLAARGRRAGTISHRDLKAHVGDLSTFCNVRASATVITEGKCVCLVLRHENAHRFAELLPEFRRNAELMVAELRRLRSSTWSGFDDALQVKSMVETSKFKVNRLLAAEKLELQSKYVRLDLSGGVHLMGGDMLPPLLQLKEVPVDRNWVPPSEVDLPKEMVKSMLRRSVIKGELDALSVMEDTGRYATGISQQSSTPTVSPLNIHGAIDGKAKASSDHNELRSGAFII